MQNIQELQFKYRKGSDCQDIPVIKQNTQVVPSSQYLSMMPYLREMSNSLIINNTQSELVKKNTEKSHTFKMYTKLKRPKVEGSQVGRSFPLYQSIYLTSMEQSIHKEQKFISPLKDSQTNDSGEPDKQESLYNSLRNKEDFYTLTNKLREFAIQRAERVKDIDFDVLFFSDVQQIKGSDAESGLACQEVLDQYSLIRMIRGDGNCLYSSLIYPYLEYIIINEDWELIDLIRKDQIKIIDIYEPSNINEILIPASLSKPLILEFLGALREAKKKIKDILTDKSLQFYHLSQLLFLNANETNGFYDLLIVLMRSIALSSFEKNKAKQPFSNFIPEGSENEISEQIKTFESEADYLTISLICEILPLKVQIIEWENPQCLKSPYTILSENLKKKQPYLITLKYAPEHYDILYQSKFAQNWFIFDFELEYLQQGYCSLCENFVDDQLIRFKKCSHTFCLQQNHLQISIQKSKTIPCGLQKCTVQVERELLRLFYQIKEKELIKQTLFFFQPLY